VFQRVWIFVSAEIKSSIVFDAAGALGTDDPMAKVAITATTADFINLDLNTDFPRIQIKEMGLYPISMRELMPLTRTSQLSFAENVTFF
jgi:hypothetical protein